MPRRGAEVSYEKRVAIIVFRLFLSMTFAVIAEKLDIRPQTVRDIYSRAIERTQPDLRGSFMDVVRNVKDAPRSGRPAIIPAGSPASAQLRQLFLEHFELPIEVVTSYIAGIKVARSTAESVAHKHREYCNKELVRVVQPIKPYITFDIQDLRMEFAHWVTERLNEGAVFIFVDETYIHFGGQPRKKAKITKPKGEDPTPYARHEPPEQFQLMLWAAIGPYADEVPFPHWIWESETEEEKEKAKVQLKEVNTERKKRVESQQTSASIPDTKECRALQEINANIDAHNRRLRAQGHTGNKGTKRRRKAEQIFKFVELKRENAKGGIDWWLYRTEVLLQRLIPYYHTIQARHAGEVYIIEDSVGLHGKAWESLGEIGVRRAPWISNSPDLNQIEPMWGYIKDMLWDMRVFSAGQAIKQAAKSRMASEWAATGLKQLAKRHIDGYRDKVGLVIEHEGNNSFRG